jgi:hypothetical protein
MVLATLLVAALAGNLAPVDLVVAGVDRDYRGALPPVSWEAGGISGSIAMPNALVSLHRHRLELTPLGAGRFAAVAELEVSGSGDATVLVAFADPPTQLQEVVLAPRQTLLVRGLVEARGGADGSLTLTLVESPAAVAVRVQSRLADGMTGLCAILVGSGPCAALAQRLERVEVPGPPAGTKLELPAGSVDLATLSRLGIATR